MNSRWNRVILAAWIVAIGSSEPGCSASSHGSSGDLAASETAEDPDGEVLAEVCEHMAEGPARAIRAVPFGDANPPSVATPHTRYDLEFAAVEGGNGGDVSLPVALAGTLWIALSADVPVEVLRSLDGQPVTVAEEVSPSRLPCREVARVLALPVPIGTLVIRLGPAPGQGVSMVLEVMGEDHGHEH